MIGKPIWIILACLALSVLPFGCRSTDTVSTDASTPQQSSKQEASTVSNSNPRVKLETSKGDIVLELDPAAAPATVENFLAYVNDGFYSGTIFHRVIPNFMIQGGGMTADMEQKNGRAPIKNEANNGLNNDRGTISMARTSDPHSATSQFFISVKDNEFLNYRDEQNPGYAVFGRVVEGMDVVDAIVGAPTHRVGYHDDVPQQTITLLSAAVLDAAD